MRGRRGPNRRLSAPRILNYTFVRHHADGLVPSFLFWNVRKNALSPLVAEACEENDIDFALLAECEVDEPTMLAQLNGCGGSRTYTEVRKGISRIRFFTRLPTDTITPVLDDGGLSIRRINPIIGREIILVAAHLPSKLHTDPETQYKVVRDARVAIEEAESLAGHTNTIIIGDLNLNPFEVPMVAADGFHAVMDRHLVAGSRTVQGDAFSFFYNPMWSAMGDRSSGPPGTYFYNKGSIVNYFWNTFDQVLLRQSLLDVFDHDGVRVLTQIGSTYLLKNDRIDASISDHLPIVVNVAVERYP